MRTEPTRAIYLDNAASAPLEPMAVEAMRRASEALPANPASIHRSGLRAARAVEGARAHVAGRLGVDPEEVIFTGSATEANNLAIKGAVWAAGPCHIVVSAIEHPSVGETAAWLSRIGHARVTHVPVDTEGRVDPAAVAAALRPDTVLVSVMQVNNEVGTIQPIAAIGRICRDAGVLLHVDAAQGFLKVPLDPRGWGVDLVTLSGHKVHGPRGIGALYIRRGVALTPLVHGGGHEGGLRSGTLAVEAIVGFEAAIGAYTGAEAARVAALRASFVRQLHAAVPGVRIHGPEHDVVGTIVNFALPGRTGKAVFTALDRAGIAISASSACHATRLTPSHVLLAMGQPMETADEAVRLSLGRFTTEAELDAAVAALAELVPQRASA